MTCKLCSKPALKSDSLCRHHHIESNIERWLDNTNLDDDTRGILAFIKENLNEFAYNATPKHHRLILQKIFELYRPGLKNKWNRLLNLIAFRGSAKSTLSNTLLVIYLICMNGRTMKISYKGETIECKINERLICILSETTGSSEDFTTRIRDQFTENARLRYYFNFMIQDAQENDTGLWTKLIFRINGCYIMGSGVGKQIRGKVRGVSRPTLILVDDLYSEKNVTTEESRAKIKKWWNNSVKNTADDLTGKMVVMGTILHEDTILVELKENDMWETVEIPLMPIENFEKFVKEHIKLNHQTGMCRLPFDEIEDKDERRTKQIDYYEKTLKSYDWELAWPERQDLYYMALQYKEAWQNHAVSGIYQEYFHIVVAESQKKFKRKFFQNTDVKIEYKYGYNWLRCEDLYSNTPKVCSIQFGVDMAAGTKEGDNTVITITAATEDGRRFLLYQFAGQTSIRDTLSREDTEWLRYNKVVLDRSLIQRTGWYDECFRLSLIYHPERIKVGVAGEEIAHIEELRKVFRSNGDYTTQIIPRPQTIRDGNKHERIMNTLLPYYETMMVYHCSDLEMLEHQLEFLGKAKKDDMADSEECSFWQLKTPEKISMDIFETKKSERVPEALTHFDWQTC